MKPALLLSLFLLGNSLAWADTTAELTEQIKAAAKAEAKETRKSKDRLAEHSSSILEGLVLEFDQAEMDNRSTSLLRLVEQVEMATNSNQLEELCRKAAQQMRAERQQKGTALVEEMRTSFAAVLKAALTAQDTKALDAPLAKVRELVEKGGRDYPSNPELPALTAQGRSLLEFLVRWQEYLAGLETENAVRSSSHLRSLLDARSDFSAFMPRSELLARITEIENAHKGKPAEVDPKTLSSEEFDQRARAIVAGIRDFRDLDDALPKLEESVTKATRSASAQSLQYTLDNLRSLQRAHLDLDQGLATNIPITITNYSTPAVSNALYALREQLLLTALPRLLDIDGAAPRPKPGDNAPTYLQRTADEALKKENWPQLKRTIEVALALNIGIATTMSDRSALQSFIAGIDQEEARQYPLAVGSYLSALRSGSQMISATRIGGRLDAIRKSHPQDYEEGIQLERKPAFPPDMRELQARSGARPGGASVPGIGTATVPPAMLTVPAARPK